MVATLFYAESLPDAGGLAVVDGDEGFHAATVRRIRAGETLTISDGAGVVADCVVEHAGKTSLSARVLARHTVAPPQPPVTVVQAIPKSDRAELAVELATEAGADEFVPWQSQRCVARWDGDRAAKGLRRWRSVVRSAARQSRRPYIPGVADPVSTDALATDLARRVAAGAVVLALHESAEQRLFAELVVEEPLDRASSIVLLVGPEGGITDGELDVLVAAGARPVRLGPHVLRTSTAAAVALGAIGVLTGRWR